MIALRIVGALYLMSGLWCAWQSELASAYLGFELLSDLAKSEFLSVYGGLQVGLGIAMLASSFKPSCVEGALLFAYLFSVTLFVFRVGSSILYGWNPAVLAMVLLEALIALGLCIALAKFRRNTLAL